MRPSYLYFFQSTPHDSDAQTGLRTTAINNQRFSNTDAISEGCSFYTVTQFLGLISSLERSQESYTVSNKTSFD